MEKEIIYIGDVKVVKSERWWNYGASEGGDVYRLDTGKRMAQNLHGREGNEYLNFRACHNNKPSNARVNIIVAECWCENDDPELKVDVNHRDGNKLNNHKDNLEWVTKSQNQRHAVVTGLRGSGDKLYNASMSDSVAHQVCQHLQDGWRVKDISSKFELPKDNIRKLKAGDTYFHVRVLYNIDHTYKNDLSESTVRWLCEKINRGLSDRQIVEASDSEVVTRIECKRIRYKIRYKLISDEYF